MSSATLQIKNDMEFHDKLHMVNNNYQLQEMLGKKLVTEYSIIIQKLIAGSLLIKYLIQHLLN